MNYQQAVDYIQSLTDYEKTPGVQYTSTTCDLQRVEEVLAVLGSPQLKARTAHIAGTKGKGSTTAMIASALSSSGYLTGMYTSPHFRTIRERIQVNGEMIAEYEFADVATRIRPCVETVNATSAPFALTTFEVLTVLAFVYFAERGVKYQAIEVGLGGRLDATNVVKPDVCVVTSISMDHMEVLGKTIEAIAAEKAGIIKPQSTVVCAPQDVRAYRVVADHCLRNGARLIRIGEDISFVYGQSDSRRQMFTINGRLGRYDLEIPLLGQHQMENAACAVGALEVLAEHDAGITKENVSRGLASVKWPGRLHVLRERPWLVCDGAHNADSAAKLRQAVQKYFKFQRSLLVVGTSADKDVPGIVTELAPLCSEVIVTRSGHPRSAQPEALAEEFLKHSIPASIARSVPDALEIAMAKAKPEDLVCVTGSLFVVGETLDWAERQSSDRGGR